MLRSTITTKDGLRFLVEARNPEHLLKILERVSHGDEVSVQLYENNDLVEHVTINNDSKKKVKAGRKKGQKYGPRWTERDILAIARIVRDHAYMEQGLSTVVRKYINNYADCKARSNATIYTMVSEFRRYFNDGTTAVLPKKTRKMLDNAGLLPGSGAKKATGATTSSYANAQQTSYLGGVRKINVVEA